MQELIYPRPCADEHLIDGRQVFIVYNMFKMHGRHGRPGPWKHYVRAIKESEPILDAEAHKKRKKQAA